MGYEKFHHLLGIAKVRQILPVTYNLYSCSSVHCWRPAPAGVEVDVAISVPLDTRSATFFDSDIARILRLEREKHTRVENYRKCEIRYANLAPENLDPPLFRRTKISQSIGSGETTEHQV